MLINVFLRRDRCGFWDAHEVVPVDGEVDVALLVGCVDTCLPRS